MKLFVGALACLAVGCSGSSMRTSPMVAVSGTIVESSDQGTPTPLAGATVSIVGTSTSTTSGSDGSYSLMAPAGSTVFIVASMSSVLGGEEALVVPANGTSGLDIAVTPSSVVQQVATSLNPQLAVDSTKGIITIGFPSNRRGYGAALSASHGMTFADAATGHVVYSTTTLGGVDTPSVLSFPNVTTGNTTVMLTAPSGSTTCTLAQNITHWPIVANTLLVLHAKCQ